MIYRAKRVTATLHVYDSHADSVVFHQTMRHECLRGYHLIPAIKAIVILYVG